MDWSRKSCNARNNRCENRDVFIAAKGSLFSLTTKSTQKTATINSTSPKILVQFYRTAAKVYIDDILIKTSEPVTQASAITFSSVASASMTTSWTNGSGGRRAVFMKAGSGAKTNPSDGTAYTASSDWNSKGSQLSTSGYYCIYNGTGNSVSLTNLLASTTYYFQIFEYYSIITQLLLQLIYLYRNK